MVKRTPKSQKKLGTPRLLLTPLEPTDAQWIWPFANDLEVSRWVARIPHPYTQEMADEFIAFINETRPAGQHLAYAIHIKHPRQPIGVIGLDKESKEENDTLAEIGYWLARPYWQKGYATEALKRWISFAFSTLGLQKLTSGHFVGNDASANVLKKAGFHYTGTTHWQQCLARGESVKRLDMILFRTDWQEADI